MSSQIAGSEMTRAARRGQRWWAPYAVALVLGNIFGLTFMVLFRATQSPRARDIFGTAFAFSVIIQFTVVFILGEKFLENFKSH
jgi:drug/metabolite transporter (DMT)-like permease